MKTLKKINFKTSNIFQKSNIFRVVENSLCLNSAKILEIGEVYVVYLENFFMQ